MNVDEYLAHINYKGSLEPTLSTLTDLLQCHKQTIPYTNIDAIITKRWRLDPTDFYKQVIKNKGGGTCIDINYMFSCFLEKVGFKTIFLPSCFYIDSSEQWSELYGHVFVAIDFGERGRFVVDASYQFSGPMKLQPMVPYVEQRGIYRFRNVAEEENWFYLERHKKTVLNKQGEVLKQGPGCWNRETVSCDEECQREKSCHWKAIQKFHAISVEIEAFKTVVESQIQENIVDNFMLFQTYSGGYHSVLEKKFYVKKCPDPLTVVIIIEKELKTREDFEEIARNIFGFKVIWQPNNDV